MSANALRLASRRIAVHGRGFSSTTFKATTKNEGAQKVLLAAAGLAAATVVLSNREVRIESMYEFNFGRTMGCLFPCFGDWTSPLKSVSSVVYSHHGRH